MAQRRLDGFVEVSIGEHWKDGTKDFLIERFRAFRDLREDRGRDVAFVALRLAAGDDATVF